MESLPKLRADLVSYQQAEAGGQKKVVLRDPVAQRYYQLSEYEYNLLKMLDGSTTVEEAVDRLKQAGHYYSLSDAKQITVKASQLGLLLGTSYGAAKRQVAEKERIRKAAKTKFLSSVYFLFIPVLNPDRFLERTLWLFKYLANKWTALLFALAAPGALYLIVSGISRIQLEYLFFFNFENLLFLWITIALTKLIHEFSHAYTAKSLGLYVPEMGVAFLIFFPCLYCNTTDAWQLADRKQRAAIAAAGIVAEAALAVLATYVWYFTRPGMVNSLAFYLMAVSFTSTLLFNGNPLLKFDGYFLLTDVLGMPNLYTNSFRHLKYLFMNRVMGVDRIPRQARNPWPVGPIHDLWGMCFSLPHFPLHRSGCWGLLPFRQGAGYLAWTAGGFAIHGSAGIPGNCHPVQDQAGAETQVFRTGCFFHYIGNSCRPVVHTLVVKISLSVFCGLSEDTEAYRAASHHRQRRIHTGGGCREKGGYAFSPGYFSA